jgi:hypothetical protein
VLLSGRAHAINIFIDYRYDPPGPNQFFNTQQKKDALQAAANRYSEVITESLLAATLSNNTQDPRISFTHPSTGANLQVSPATGPGDDALVAVGAAAAGEYRGPWSIAADQWILYPGGRSLAVAGEGGAGAGGTNFTQVFTSGTSHLNRGFRATGSTDHLAVWGGSISFDNDGSTNWHFDPNTTPPAGTLDFYTIALHEIGHALGLSADSADWDQFRAAPPNSHQFTGSQTLAAYNGDNGTSLTSLNQETANNRHWDEDVYNSRIFQNGNPKLVATVGLGAMQDLLMEPTADFTATIKRLELTNVDVAALRDLGWSTLPQINSSLPGDFNKDGTVNAADYVVFSKGLADNTYATWRANFGESTSGGSPANSPQPAGVPEPASWLFLLLALSPIFVSRRPPRSW